MSNGSLMKVKVLQNAFDLHLAMIGLKKHFWSFWEWLFYTGFTDRANSEYDPAIRFLESWLFS